MTLWWHSTGPKISYLNKVLQIEDLNPSQKITWQMSRLEMLRVGAGFIAAAFLPQRDPFKSTTVGGMED